MELAPGDVIDGKYRVGKLLGKGGMGAVYQGENIRIERIVAIKVLHAAVAENADVVKRFEREARAAARIGSDRIVDVLDLGDLPNGDRYMVMEYLEGESLGQRLKALGGMTVEQLFPIVLQLLEGLAQAHRADIVHRDLKPDNVFLLGPGTGRPDFVKILDFGISKFRGLDGNQDEITRTGAFMGTPHYMAPEQARGIKEVDGRADLYSVGVIVYRALSGALPFQAKSFQELLFKIALDAPTDIAERVPGVDPAAAAIVRRAMARDPIERYMTAAELAADVRGWLEARGVSTAPASASQNRRIAAEALTLRQAEPATIGTPLPTAQAPQLAERRSSKPWAIGAALLAVATAGGIAFVLGSNRPAPADAQSAIASTAHAAPASPPIAATSAVAAPAPPLPSASASATAPAPIMPRIGVAPFPKPPPAASTPAPALAPSGRRHTREL